ncbi:MAG TPA: ATP-grasp domain-containing protein [Thermoanaerobaculia bacterium]
MKSERILVLDGQTNQALACVRSLGRAGHAVYVASASARPLAAWSRFSAGRIRVRDGAPPREAYAELCSWAQREAIGIVLPLTERSCILCDMDRAVWEAAGIRIGCGPGDMLVRAFDKEQTIRLAQASEVRVPPTVFPRSDGEAAEAGRALGFPCVVKARFSNAWNAEAGTFWADHGCGYAQNPEDLQRAVADRRQGPWWPTVQGFVPGVGRAVSVLCDRGRIVAAFAHERLRDVRPTGSGSSLRRSIALDARLFEPTRRLLAALDWHGPAMAEYRDDGGDPCLMEVNGRFWGSLQLGVDAGVDFPALWVAILWGEHPEPVLRYREGVTVRWVWGDVKRIVHIASGRPRGYAGPFPTLREGVAEVLGRQPDATRLETWRAGDRWPAFGEVAQGLRDLIASWQAR